VSGKLSESSTGPLSGVRFGRRRFLARVGAGVFAVATGAALADSALASWSETPCFGPGPCSCCNMTGSQAGNCTSCDPNWPNRTCYGSCPVSPNWINDSCWRGCGGDHRLYYCCDFTSGSCNNGVGCVCRCRVPNSSC
jgi:hypothetical protein